MSLYNVLGSIHWNFHRNRFICDMKLYLRQLFKVKNSGTIVGNIERKIFVYGFQIIVLINNIKVFNQERKL